MNRRKFLTMSVITALALPMGAWATDYRKTNPNAWTAHTVDDAVKALYGDVKLIESNDVILKMAKISSNGAQIPLTVKTDLEVKSIAIFQDVNPESSVAVFTVHEGMIVEYSMKIKMARSGTVTVVAEGKDGNFYKTSKFIETKPGCEG
jgi:sulfur-oxidizing protein SoxY